jgi:aminoacylase
MQALIKSPIFAELNVGMALDEGLANPTDAFTLFYGERAPWWVRVKATGAPGHGSRFIPDPAMQRLLRVVDKFLTFRKEQEVCTRDGQKQRVLLLLMRC